MKMATKQYGEDGWYVLVDEFGNRTTTRLWLAHRDAKERNAQRKQHGIKARWWWTGKS